MTSTNPEIYPPGTIFDAKGAPRWVAGATRHFNAVQKHKFYISRIVIAFYGVKKRDWPPHAEGTLNEAKEAVFNRLQLFYISYVQYACTAPTKEAYHNTINTFKEWLPDANLAETKDMAYRLLDTFAKY